MHGNALIDYLPLNLLDGQQVLVTSRNQDVAAALSSANSWITVGCLFPPDSLALLESRLPSRYPWFDEEHEAYILLEELNHLPLATTHAAAFMARSRLSPSQYLKMLQTNDVQLSENLSIELQDSRRPRGWPNFVFRIWRISFEELKKTCPLAARLLSIMSFLNDKQIPRELFSVVSGSSKSEVEAAIGTIFAYSPVSVQESLNMLSIYSLVSLSVQDWLKWDKSFATHASAAPAIVSDRLLEATFLDDRDLMAKQKLPPPGLN